MSVRRVFGTLAAEDCPRCRSQAFSLLGRLGSIMWLRCLSCGEDVPTLVVQFYDWESHDDE